MHDERGRIDDRSKPLLSYHNDEQGAGSVDVEYAGQTAVATSALERLDFV